MNTRKIGGGLVLVAFTGKGADVLEKAIELDKQLNESFDGGAGLIRRLSQPGRPIDIRHGTKVWISFGEFVVRQEVIDLAKACAFEIPPDQNDRVVQVPAMATANN